MSVVRKDAVRAHDTHVGDARAAKQLNRRLRAGDPDETTILRQERDATQQLFRLHFETHSRADGSAEVMWL